MAIRGEPRAERCSLDPSRHTHTHGKSTTCYNHGGCRCTPCREYMADYHRNIRDLQGVDIEVAAGPTVRRLQALAMMGWGVQYIADCTGRLSNSYLAQLRSGSRETTRRSTEASVKAVYSHLCLVRNDTSGGRRAVYWARKNGWLGPADWVDIDRGIIDG